VSRALGLVLIVSLLGCGRLPREETYPALAPFIRWGAASDGALQLARAPWWSRVVLLPAAGLTIRYSQCCRRPEGAHLGLWWGAAVVEVFGLALRELH
jgi:hypothetical protein